MKGIFSVFSNSGQKSKSKSRNTLDAFNSVGDSGNNKIFTTEPHDNKQKNKIPKHARNKTNIFMKNPIDDDDDKNDPPVRVLNYSKDKKESSYARTREELIERSNYGQM